MSRFLITGLIASLILFVPAQDNFTLTEIIRDYDPLKNVTTIRFGPEKLSGSKGRYHSLTFSVFYSYPGQTPAAAKHINIELVSVVKARTLNTDLHVAFVVDGKEFHFGSNRSAIRSPVRGKPWIGERMVFQIPREDFKNFVAAKKLSVKLGNVSFDFTEAQIDALRYIIDPDSFPSVPQQTSPHLLSSFPASAGYRDMRSR